MNELIAKKAAIFSVILGAITAFISLVPTFIGLGILTLSLFSAPIIILYMKKKRKTYGIY